MSECLDSNINQAILHKKAILSQGTGRDQRTSSMPCQETDTPARQELSFVTFSQSLFVDLEDTGGIPSSNSTESTPVIYAPNLSSLPSCPGGGEVQSRVRRRGRIAREGRVLLLILREQENMGNRVHQPLGGLYAQLAVGQVTHAARHELEEKHDPLVSGPRVPASPVAFASESEPSSESGL
jgi:hypothetical protein